MNAFPIYGQNPDTHGGMDLRDYFAAKAPGATDKELLKLSGDNVSLKLNEYGRDYEALKEWRDSKSMEEILILETKFRYIWADAMMKAREE